MTQSNLPDVVRVLLVDDDEEDHFIIKRLFASMKSITSELEWVSSSDEGIERINAGGYDAYLIDYRIDGRTGLDVLQEVGAHERPEPFILLTGVGDQGIERESLQLAASDYLIKKNLTSDSLARALYYALGRKEQERHKIDQLLELNRTKDEFISIASHQLRTPATSVKQYVAMVLEGMAGDISDKQQALLNKAYESNERQLTIINNLLKVAQIDSGTYALARSTTNVSQLAHDAADDFLPLVAKSKQQISRDIEDGITADIDENAVRMIIDNLLENANKYSEEGSSIRIAVRRAQGVVEIVVSDEGVGVEEPERLFKKFSRIQNKLSTQANGTGLGLYWAQTIARLHGGDLVFIANQPHGSIFTLQLPCVK